MNCILLNKNKSFFKMWILLYNYIIINLILLLNIYPWIVYKLNDFTRGIMGYSMSRWVLVIVL